MVRWSDQYAPRRGSSRQPRTRYPREERAPEAVFGDPRQISYLKDAERRERLVVGSDESAKRARAQLPFLRLPGRTEAR
jgi:hypothetical protein